MRRKLYYNYEESNVFISYIRVGDLDLLNTDSVSLCNTEDSDLIFSIMSKKDQGNPTNENLGSVVRYFFGFTGCLLEWTSAWFRRLGVG